MAGAWRAGVAYDGALDLTTPARDAVPFLARSHVTSTAWRGPQREDHRQMRMTRLRRSLALVTAAALLATLAAATVAAPTSAAKPKCQGQTATIVGTKKADVIRGTAKRDVIVAKGGRDIVIGRGGNDIICGGAGNDRLVGKAGSDRLIGGPGSDRLFGGPGPDRLFGGPGPDTLAGQTGNDVLDRRPRRRHLLPGPGQRAGVRCELPALPRPTLLPLTDILAVAYSDVDGLDGYSTGDSSSRGHRPTATASPTLATPSRWAGTRRTSRGHVRRLARPESRGPEPRREDVHEPDGYQHGRPQLRLGRRTAQRQTYYESTGTSPSSRTTSTGPRTWLRWPLAALACRKRP